MTDATMLHSADDAQIADWIEERLRRALAVTDGTVSISLPGGSTPFPILELLVARELEWGRITVTPTDDRVVPEDHPASNAGRLFALFDPLFVDVYSLVDIEAQGGQFAGGGGPFIGGGTLVWLGMGADGHIASLFPNTDPQVDDPLRVRRITPDPLPPEAPFDRVTQTIPALLDCDELLFVIRGEDKRRVFEAALRGEHDLPIARLLAARNRGYHRAHPIPVTCFT
jgi:6-phosphogluconolactonase